MYAFVTWRAVLTLAFLMAGSTVPAHAQPRPQPDICHKLIENLERGCTAAVAKLQNAPCDAALGAGSQQPQSAASQCEAADEEARRVCGAYERCNKDCRSGMGERAARHACRE